MESIQIKIIPWDIYSSGGINTFLVSSTMHSLLLEVILLRGLKDLPFGSDWLRIKCLQKNQIRTQRLGTISLSGYGSFWASNACGSQLANLFAIIYLKRRSLASLSIIRTRPRSRRSSIWGRIKSGKRAEYFYFLHRDSGRSRFVPIFMPDKMRQECVRARSAAGCALIILAPEGVDERARRAA